MCRLLYLQQTCLHEGKKKIKNHTNVKDAMPLSSSAAGKTTFQAFLKSEFSDENIEFWMKCEDFKKIRSNATLTSRAKKIFERYIQAEAPREVINFDFRACYPCSRLLTGYRSLQDH